MKFAQLVEEPIRIVPLKHNLAVQGIIGPLTQQTLRLRNYTSMNSS